MRVSVGDERLRARSPDPLTPFEEGSGTVVRLMFGRSGRPTAAIFQAKRRGELSPAPRLVQPTLRL